MKVTAYTMSKQFIENNEFCRLSNVPTSLFFVSFSKNNQKEIYFRNHFLSDSSPIWLIRELETSLQVFILMCSVDRHWFPSFWPWARYSSICWDFQLAISQQFVLRDAELWPPLLWVVAFLPCAISSPICQWFFWKILFCVLIVCHQHCACSVLTSHQPPVLVSVL